MIHPHVLSRLLPVLLNSLLDLVTFTRTVQDFLIAGNFCVNKSQLINNFSLLLDSVQNYGMPFLKILRSIPRRSLNRKIHALLLNLLYSEDAYLSKQTVVAKLIAGFQYTDSNKSYYSCSYIIYLLIYLFLCVDLYL